MSVPDPSNEKKRLRLVRQRFLLENARRSINSDWPAFLRPFEAEDGERLRRRSREDHDLPHQHLRAGAAGQSYVCRDRERNPQRIFRARRDFPVARRHWRPGGCSPARQPACTAVVGNAGFARESQPHVAAERQRALCGNAVPGACQRAERDGAGSAIGLRRCIDGGQSAVGSSGAPGGLFAGILGRDGQQGRGGAEHAAQRDGRQGILPVDEDFSGPACLGIGDHGGFPQAGGADLGPEPAVLLHPVDRVDRRAGVQAGVHGVPNAEGLPRHGQDFTGPGHLPYAGGYQD